MRRHLQLAIFTSLAVLLCVESSLAQVSVWTHHNDNGRTGANLAETQLTTANVNSSTFGRLFSYIVDGDVYTQPLVITNVAVAGKGTHDVVYVATLNNSVYAFDANSNRGTNGQPLWYVNFNNPAAGITPVPAGDVQQYHNIRNPGPVGILGTPVIDRATNTMYLVARTKEVSSGSTSYVQRLHALDIRSGAEKFGGPVAIQAAVPGTGYDAVNGVVSFNPLRENQRLALTLANGMVYIGWASHEDKDPYHGWLMAYDAATLQQVRAWCSTPNGSQAGIWQAGQGLTIDGSGNVYVMIGNGSFSANQGGRNYGESMVKLTPTLDTVLDWFTPDNWAALNQGDLDFGSSGSLLLPGTPYVMGGGKDGTLFVMDTADLGKLSASDMNVKQLIQVTTNGNIHGGPVYWNGPNGPMVYLWAEQDYLKGYHFNGAIFDTPPATQSTFTAPNGMPGGFLSISANGGQAGTGVVWATMPWENDAVGAVVNGVLRAFDATNLSRMLWSSHQNVARDNVGSFGKFAPPTVANGKVYVSTFSRQLQVYGLLATLPPSTGGTLSGSATAGAAPVDLSAVGTLDWAAWPGYIRKAAGAGQISDISAVDWVRTYTNDPRTVVWSDGTTPTGSTTSGLYVSGIGNGYVLVAPAGTTTRTLRVYVGGWNSGGTLSARLSDGSAPDYISAQASSSGQYDMQYTLTYQAASDGQQLLVEWLQSSGNTGNVTLQAAALSGAATPPAAPGNVAATDGALATVTVTWTASPGATSYTVYRSTVAGTQGSAIGAPTTTSFVDSSAVAGTTYYYSVTATGVGGTSSPSAQDSGYAVSPPVGSGSLSGSAVPFAATVDLTAAGTSDWARWPGYDHKASGGAQILNVTANTTINTYSNDPRRVTWTDGTPTASGSTTNGIFLWNMGSAFTVRAPADTTARTLTVYVGGWNSTGQLTAHLSDGSAVDFVSPMISGVAQYSGTYTLAYQAGAANQQLIVTWQQVAGTGNVTLQAATLAGPAAPPTPPPVPTNVSASDGTGPTVSISWTASSGATSYTVYRSTAAGTQGSAIGTSTTPSFTDVTAVAGTTYYYSVTATGTGGTSSASAQNSGYAVSPPVGGGSLSGSVVPFAATVNLTAAGTSDWARWPGYDHKASGGAQILNVTANATINTYSNDPRRVTWTDGTPTASGSTTNGVFLWNMGSAFTVRAPADTTARTLTVYVGGWNSTGQLTAHLSDGSAPDFVSQMISGAAQYSGTYTLAYQAASAGQQLVVTWQQVAGTGNVTLQAATLAGPAAPPTPPPVPTNVSASDGTGTTVSVTWTASSGATSYTVYRSTAAGTQGSAIGTPTTPSFTDGTATGGTTYYYSVTATGTGGTSTPSAQDSGYAVSPPPPGSGSLSGAVLPFAATVNLTTAGTSDWARWPGYDHKASGGGKILNVTANATINTYSNDPRAVSWSDGTPTVSGNTNAGIFLWNTGSTFTVKAPADTTSRTLTVFVGGWNSTGQLTAHLSDGSAVDFVSPMISGERQYSGTYELTYKAGAAGQQLIVTWKQTAGSGNVTLQAATLR